MTLKGEQSTCSTFSLKDNQWLNGKIANYFSIRFVNIFFAKFHFFLIFVFARRLFFHLKSNQYENTSLSHAVSFYSPSYLAFLGG